MLRSYQTLRKIIYGVIGVLILVVFGLSLYQTYLLNFGPDPITYSGVPAGANALPQEENRGAFLQLKPGVSPGAGLHFPSNLVQLLETTEPGVVDAPKLLQIEGGALDAVIVHQATIDTGLDQYRVYAVGKDPQEMRVERLAGGRMVRIQPSAGPWQPGSYLVDVPSGGMFDTSRLYYAFAIK